MSLNISLILVPAKEQEIKIRESINLLAHKYHSYPFVPHITVYHFGTTSLLDEITNFIDTKLTDIHPFSLEMDKIDYSDVFTKTLFATYKINSSLSHLYDTFHNQFKIISDYALTPHLSMIYKNGMKNKDKEREIAGLNLPKKLIIDRLYVITKISGSIKEEKDILLWNTAHKITFK